LGKNFTISSFSAQDNFEVKLKTEHGSYLNWPLVYLLKDDTSKTAYVGETTDVLTRLTTHKNTPKKKALSSINIILSELFNKSATLDLESNLIRYISADGTYALQNGNLGITNHQYYNQKEVYWDLFKDVWGELQGLGIARQSLEHIDNSDLFKYSPYKSLSKGQAQSLKLIMRCLLNPQQKVSLINGGAGTGKSILAIFLFKLLKTDLTDFNYADFDEEDVELFDLLKQVKDKYGALKMALVVPMASFRKTVSNVFKNIQGLSPKMVIGPSQLAAEKYDLVIVDEGHRLRRRVNLGSYFGTFDKNCEALGLDKFTASELDWVQQQSQKAVIFYDHNQSVKPSDALKQYFQALVQNPTTGVANLETQFRVKGGNKYVHFVNSIFSNQGTQLPNQPQHFNDYEFFLYDDLDTMVADIKFKERANGLSRMVAGFAWDWISKNNKQAFDIVIGQSQLRWNSVAIDWVNSPNAINEVGCIHTTQGYDLNYTGVIIGHELDYDFQNQCLVVYKENYKDKNGRNGIANPHDLLAYILNIYKTIMLRGIKGTFIYVCNSNLRKYLSQFVPVRSAQEQVAQIQFSNTPAPGCIPYYNLAVAAGSFSDLQLNRETTYIRVDHLSDPADYFACRVVGESMNKVIPNGSICLFKKYTGGSRNGLIMLVEGTDSTDAEFGSRYTVKEYSSKKTVTDDGWHHEEIKLLPKSFDDSFKPIVLHDDETVHLKVLGEFVRIIR